MGWGTWSSQTYLSASEGGTLDASLYVVMKLKQRLHGGRSVIAVVVAGEAAAGAGDGGADEVARGSAWPELQGEASRIGLGQRQ